jgi:Uma2 family endonuclease
MPGCDPVQPDLIVVRREQLDIVQARIEGVPALLVEVLSPSNPHTDRETKYRAYARAGVPEYWIIRPSERDVLVHSQPDSALGDYLQSDHVSADGELVSPTLPVRVSASAFFADAPSTRL